jgi:hypothetical protein
MAMIEKTKLKPTLLSLLALGASALPAMAMDMTEATKAYAEVLERNLTPGDDGILLFDYAAAHTNGDHAIIEAYIEEQAQATPSEMNEAEALAYWANLYNAVTLDVVLDGYPIKSIRQFGAFNTGPWDREVLTVEGEVLSLNDMEHVKMREQYPSPYIHYMVNCASIGCPNLRAELWDAETLEADQKAAAADYINSDRGLTWNGKTLAISKIYKWYSEDFGSKDDLRAHFATYATGEKREALLAGKRFKGSHYDWDLNAPKK